MALMEDSVNTNTDEINNVSQTHVDDEGQPLSADVDIWFQETLKPILVTYIFCFIFMSTCDAKVDQKNERVSRPESISTGREQRR